MPPPTPHRVATMMLLHTFTAIHFAKWPTPNWAPTYNICSLRAQYHRCTPAQYWRCVWHITVGRWWQKVLEGKTTIFPSCASWLVKNGPEAANPKIDSGGHGQQAAMIPEEETSVEAIGWACRFLLFCHARCPLWLLDNREGGRKSKTEAKRSWLKDERGKRDREEGNVKKIGPGIEPVKALVQRFRGPTDSIRVQPGI